MRKKFITILFTLLFAAGLVTLNASPALAANCDVKIDRHSQYVTDGDGSLADDALVQLTVHYNYCTTPEPLGQQWARVVSVTTAVNWPGGTLDCDYGRYRDGARFNWYFWRPVSGANFNPGGYTVPCDESSINSVSKWYAEHPDNVRLYFGPDLNRPRWKANFTITQRFDKDRSDFYGQAFQPF